MNTILVIILIAIVLFLIVEFIKYRIKSMVYKKQCNEEEPNENN